jgi:ABC-type Fe3+/spermidine/putrescine transport system ATPase subunit
VTHAAVLVQNVAKRFKSRQALGSVTLEVPAGESVVILGPSGCGKTTLLRLIAGLEIPDSGEIWLDGARVADAGRSLVPPYRRRIGFVFQDLALWPHLTVAGHLRFVLDALKIRGAGRDRRIDDTLQLVRIGDLGSRHPHELSGGEQQRVALARALIGHPRLLLLDEPLSSLDTDLRATMRAELARIRRSLAVTLIYVTHDREDAAVLADRVIEMRAGRIAGAAESGPMEERA